MRSSAKKRSRAFPRQRIRIYGTLFILLVLAVAGGIFGREVYRSCSRMFPLGEITVSGNMHLSSEEVKSLTGLHTGTGLLTISLREISGRLLRSPWIRAVSVRKEFPDGLQIKISEAVPFAILDTGGQAFLIDERGRMLEKVEGTTVPFLPIITADPGKQPENFAEAIRLAAVLKDKKIAAERGRVEVVANGKGPEEIALVVDGIVIKTGYGDYEQKLDRLSAIEEEIRRRAITVDYVDLRFTNRIVVKPINEVIR